MQFCYTSVCKFKDSSSVSNCSNVFVVGRKRDMRYTSTFQLFMASARMLSTKSKGPNSVRTSFIAVSNWRISFLMIHSTSTIWKKPGKQCWRRWVWKDKKRGKKEKEKDFMRKQTKKERQKEKRQKEKRVLQNCTRPRSLRADERRASQWRCRMLTWTGRSRKPICDMPYRSTLPAKSALSNIHPGRRSKPNSRICLDCQRWVKSCSSHLPISTWRIHKYSFLVFPICLWHVHFFSRVGSPFLFSLGTFMPSVFFTMTTFPVTVFSYRLKTKRSSESPSQSSPNALKNPHLSHAVRCTTRSVYMSYLCRLLSFWSAGNTNKHFARWCCRRSSSDVANVVVFESLVVEGCWTAGEAAGLQTQRAVMSAARRERGLQSKSARMDDPRGWFKHLISSQEFWHARFDNGIFDAANKVFPGSVFLEVDPARKSLPCDAQTYPGKKLTSSRMLSQ